jgi:hypothetical protein
MKFSNRVVWFLAVVVATPLPAQPEASAQLAEVSFFNATESEKPVYIDWSGRNAFPDGLAAGSSMGPLMVPAEAVTITAKSDGTLPATAPVRLAGGDRTTLIFSEGPLEKDPQGEQPKPRLRVYQTPAVQGSLQREEYAWPIIYVGPAQTVSVKVNGELMQLTRDKIALVGRGKKIVRVEQGDREIAAISVEEPCRRLFVLYGPSDELRGGVVFQ